MEFEPLEEDLEECLLSLLEIANDESVNLDTPLTIEHRELERLGYISDISEFIDGTSEVSLAYDALKYSDRKAKWKKENVINSAKGVAGTIIDKGIDVAVNIATKMPGM